MSLPQQKFREMVFQVLYSKDSGYATPEAMVELMMHELNLSKKYAKQAYERVEKIFQNLDNIDSLISSVSTSYDFSRIQTVAKNILRLGVYELLFDSTIPPKVAIAEAMRLARKFGSPESALFVNALLDKLYQASLGINVDDIDLKQRLQEYMNTEDQSQKKGAENQHLKEEQNLL